MDSSYQDDADRSRDATEKFWAALRSDMTVMLESASAEPRPMTSQLDSEEDRGPIWFFTSTDSDLAEGKAGEAASFTFVDKGHGLWANVRGTLTQNNDRAVIDRLWSPFVAAWYKGGKDDPTLALMRFDPADAKIWFDANTLWAGIKMLFGSDPKVAFKDKVAEVPLR